MWDAWQRETMTKPLLCAQNARVDKIGTVIRRFKFIGGKRPVRRISINRASVWETGFSFLRF